jgi:S-formylglutathione hydrolase
MNVHHLFQLSTQKGNFLGPAAKEGIAILCTDTSPRGAGIEGEDDDWDFGTGMFSPLPPPKMNIFEVSLYVFLHRRRLLPGRHQSKVRPPLQHAHAHSIRDPASFGNRRSTHREPRLSIHCFAPMLNLVVQDLTRMSIFGHSMGGHGALCTYLASKSKPYRSASAFAPVANPINSPWGQKAFAGYLQGGTQEAREQYDATELIARHSDPVHILIDYVRQ